MARKSAAATRRELLERIQIEGAEVGYQAALEVARDKTAAAPAKATAAGLLLRAAGLLGTKPADFEEKEPANMSYDELNQAVERIRNGGDVEDDEPGVFD